MWPLDLGETLDAAFKIVRRRWRTLALVTAAVAIPVEFLSFVVSALTLDRGSAGTPALLTDGGTATDDAGVTGAAVVATLTLVGSLLGTVACYRAVTDTYAGRDTSVEASLRFAAARLAPALWLTILLIVGLVAGFLACVLPGIWLGVAWSVAVPVLLVEGLTGTAALGRSYALVQDRWWATFGRLFVAYVIALVASGVVTAVLTAPVDAAAGRDSLTALAVQHVAGALTSLIATPFIAAVTALVYFDLRARKEGFDPRGDEPEAPPAAPPETPAPPSTPPPSAPASPWLPPVAPERPPGDGHAS